MDDDDPYVCAESFYRDAADTLRASGHLDLAPITDRIADAIKTCGQVVHRQA